VLEVVLDRLVAQLPDEVGPPVPLQPRRIESVECGLQGFEREQSRRVAGVVSRSDVRALLRVVGEAEEESAPKAPPLDEAALTSDGLAVPLASAPPEVAAVI